MNIQKINLKVRNYHYTIYGFYTIIILILSVSISTFLNPPPIHFDSAEAESFLEESLDFNQVSEEVNDNLVNQLNTSEKSFSVASDEIPTFKSAFRDIFFGDFINTQSDQNDASQRVIGQAQTISKPRIKLHEPDLSGLTNISIPILSSEEAREVKQMTRTEKRIITIGLDYDFTISKSVVKGIKKKIEFGFNGRFKFLIHFAFPVEITVEYPAGIVKDVPYALNCTLRPIDRDNYHEFQITLDIHFKVYFKARVPWLTHKTIKVLGVPVAVVPKIEMKWKTIADATVDYDFDEYDDYTTPLGNQPAKINIPGRIDIIDEIKYAYPPWTLIVWKLCSAGIKFGYIELSDSIISANMEVSAGNDELEKRRVIWNNTDEMNSLDFTISESSEPLLSLSIDEFYLHTNRLQSVPQFYFHFKDQKLIHPVFPWEEIKLPLKKWLGGEYTFDLPPCLGGFTITEKTIRIGFIKQKIQFMNILNGLGLINIPSTDYYTVPGISFISPEMYDFKMDVNEITPPEGQGALATTQAQDQLYEIKLENLGTSKDLIELGVSGLPTGYSATFSRPVVTLSRDPVEILLYLSPPDHLDVPPGDMTFEITATSHAKEYFGLPDSTVAKSVQLAIPEVVDYSFNLDTNLEGIVQVHPGQYVPINFFGGNGGNLNDTIQVNATLHLDDTNLTWTDSFQVDPYGSGQTQYYNGEFGFTYDINKLYPSPGLYTLEISAINSREPLIVKNHTITLDFMETYGAKGSITPNSSVIFANWEANFTLTINNTGNVIDNFTLITDGWDDYLTLSTTKVLNLEPMESTDLIINLRITEPDEVPEGFYEFRVIAISEASSGLSGFYIGDVVLTIFAPDYVPPGITFVESDYSNSTVFPTTSLTLGPSWVAFDEWPDVYTIEIDGSPPPEPWATGTWLEGVPIQVPVTGSYQLSPGLHNITITFADNSSNVASDQLWVNITGTDTIAPVIGFSPNDQTFPENFAFLQYLRWNCTEEFLLNVTIYLDDITLPSTDFTVYQGGEAPLNSLVEYIINPGFLTIGIHNYTLLLQDMNNNLVSSSVFITIDPPDTIDPEITHPPAASGIQAHGAQLSLTFTDSFPGRYELWINSTLEVSGIWQSGNTISLNVDELNLIIGYNTLEFRAYDLADNFHSESWSYLLWDIDPPTLLNTPTDFTIFEHNISLNDIPFWELEDLNPANYSIYQDGILIQEGTWGLATQIQVPVANLTAGSYIFQARFRDTSGNENISFVNVVVEDILPPYVWPIDPIKFEPLFAPDWFELVVSELHPHSYNLYKNGSLIGEGSLASIFPIILVRIDYSPGLYSYKLVVEDDSGNIGEESILVNVTDFTAPYVLAPPDLIYSEGTTGNILVFEILEANPSNYSLYKNGDIISSGVLETTTLSISVDNLALGNHTYILIVQDQQGFSYSCTSNVVVVDTTFPTITRVADCRFVSGDEDAYITWVVHDLHPDGLVIKRNGTVIRDESWSGDDITLFMVGWAIGTHEIELEVRDTSGNAISDEVVAKIVNEESVTKPIKLSAPGFEIFFAFFVITIISSLKVMRRKKIHFQ
ncbi:MAG: hypothetical protein ACFFFH_04860 [Candidatus Thorarchaeota archaeon]